MTRSTLIECGVALVVVGAVGIGLWGPQIRNAPSRAETAEPSATSSTLYTCGMHPQVIRDAKGKCPICEMDLIPLPSDFEEQPSESRKVRVTPEFVQNFSVRTTEVVPNRLSRQIRTVGYLDQNESGLVSVNVKFEGWIERPRVHTVGERVSVGDVLFEVYSPELVTAQLEYLAALEYVRELRSRNAYPDAVERAQALLDAARSRLRHWDLTPEQIRRLEQTGEVRRALEVHSPASGLVSGAVTDSLEGLRLVPGMTVLKIADQSSLWVKVEFYERSVRDLRPGMKADITLDAFPGRTWRGTVALFRPSMNPGTQTLTGFIEIDNGDGLLRPKMYATVHLRLPGLGPTLTVPDQSVLYTGDRSVVVVDEGDGLFAPRQVELGVASDGLVQVLAGLKAGDHVVTSAQFLIDSESNLRAAVARMTESQRIEAATGIEQ